MQTKVQKWGNSLAVRIPATFVKEAGLSYGSAVDLSMDDGKIVIEPRHLSAYKLNELLRDVNKRNLHVAVETGQPVGGEAW
jgi:antitoxin MazE